MTPTFAEYKASLVSSLTQSGILSWPAAATAISIILVFYFDQTKKGERSLQSAFRYVFPKGLYSHRSAIQDYFIFVINIAVSAVLFFTVIFDPQVKPIVDGLTHVFGASPLALKPNVWIDVAYTVWLFLAIDLGQYLAHLIMHKFPPLWAFHKVHHSAEVLTPVTANRDHPVDDFFTVVFALAFYYPLAAGFHYVVGSTPFIVQVGGIDVISFVTFILIGHFKHSNFWFRFPNWISRIIASPAMHHVHHSCLDRHIDKNLGGTLSLWDWAFGTLYIPREEEKDQLVYGITAEKPNPFDHLGQVYYEPFLDAGSHFLRYGRTGWSRIRGKQTPAPTSSPVEDTPEQQKAA